MRVEWHDLAIVDLERLKEFVAQHNQEAALKAVRHIKAAIQHISTHPQIGKPVEGFPDYRDIVIPFGASGYVVRYRILGDAALIILAVKHGKEVGFGDQAASLWVVKEPVEAAYGMLVDGGPSLAEELLQERHRNFQKEEQRVMGISPPKPG